MFFVLKHYWDVLSGKTMSQQYFLSPRKISLWNSLNVYMFLSCYSAKSYIFIIILISFRCSTESRYDVCKTNSTTASPVLQGSDILPNITTIDLGIVESFVVLWCMILFCRGIFYAVLRYLNKPNWMRSVLFARTCYRNYIYDDYNIEVFNVVL